MEENHESISTYSRCFLQATRKDLRSLAELELDPIAQIVTIIIDVITDKKTLCRAEDPKANATRFLSQGINGGTEAADQSSLRTGGWTTYMTGRTFVSSCAR